MASLQISMAQAQTKYGDQLDSLNASYLSGSKLNKFGLNNTKATETLNDLLKSSKFKGKDENFKSQFSDLYKSIFGIKDDDKDSDTASAQSIKTASAAAGNAAESMRSLADGMKYGDTVDIDSYKKQAQSFVDSYNAMIDKVSNSDNQAVLQKGVLMVNSGKVYAGALRRAGITVGSDNKLSLNSDLSKVSAVNIKSVFGSEGFSSKVIQKAGQINSLTGGNGFFTASAVGSSGSASSKDDGYVDNRTELKELSAKVKDMSGALKEYAAGLGSEDKSYSVEEYSKAAKDFVDTYNSFLDAASKSNNSAVRNRATTLTSGAQAYKYSLQRAGINVDKNGKLSVGDKATLEKLTDKDVKYSFGGNGFLQKVNDKADQIKSLATSASAMGYNSDKTTNYAYNSGALFAVYA